MNPSDLRKNVSYIGSDPSQRMDVTHVTKERRSLLQKFRTMCESCGNHRARCWGGRNKEDQFPFCHGSIPLGKGGRGWGSTRGALNVYTYYKQSKVIVKSDAVAVEINMGFLTKTKTFRLKFRFTITAFGKLQMYSGSSRTGMDAKGIRFISVIWCIPPRKGKGKAHPLVIRGSTKHSCWKESPIQCTKKDKCIPPWRGK